MHMSVDETRKGQPVLAIDDRVGFVDSGVSGATTLIGSIGNDAVDTSNSNFGANPTLLSFEQNSIPDVPGLIDDLMADLALSGLGPGLATP